MGDLGFQVITVNCPNLQLYTGCLCNNKSRQSFLVNYYYNSQSINNQYLVIENHIFLIFH